MNSLACDTDCRGVDKMPRCCQVRPVKSGGAFTLIEVLVVVAIIALLVSILLPSLNRVREQSRRAVCASNLHQMAVGFTAYSADHRQTLPRRGAFGYSIKHVGPPDDVRVPCNVGLLYGKYCGKDLSFYYCISNQKYHMSDPVYGAASFFKEGTEPYVTWSGYLYAAPLMEWASPRDVGQKVYPRELWHSYYADWVRQQELQGRVVGRQNVKALVSDNIIGVEWDEAPHQGEGYNVLFTDYHAKWVRDPQREIYREIRRPTSGPGGAADLYHYWELFSNNP